jgi:parvulin-like peptidyl-prolyl isomerase
LKEAQDKGEAESVAKIKAELGADREGLLDQYLAQQYAQTRQYVSRQEFDLVLETNAYLRKIAEASPELTKALTEETLQKAFAAQYGEKIVVRHIQAPNAVALQEARNRINAGENFADVARELSTNRNTAPLGGAIPPFTMNATNVPEIFKQTAFALKNGEVSDPVSAENAYHLIKVENRIAPKVVKYEDVRESLRADLYDKILQAAVQQLRAKVSAQVMTNLRIENPALKAQFDKRMEDGKLRQQAQIEAAMKRDRAVPVPREGEATPAATTTTTQPK